MRSPIRHQLERRYRGLLIAAPSLAEQFEAHRSHLEAVAFRMLGSRAEADNALQEASLKLSRGVADWVANIGGWLTMLAGRAVWCAGFCRTTAEGNVAEASSPIDFVNHLTSSQRSQLWTNVFASRSPLCTTVIGNREGVANASGHPVAVRVRLRRARRRLKPLLMDGRSVQEAS